MLHNVESHRPFPRLCSASGCQVVNLHKRLVEERKKTEARFEPLRDKYRVSARWQGRGWRLLWGSDMSTGTQHARASEWVAALGLGTWRVATKGVWARAVCEEDSLWCPKRSPIWLSVTSAPTAGPGEV